MKRIDLTERTFGRLTVIERTGTDGRNSLWRCQCVCGTERIVPFGNLCRGLTRSCGCLSKELAKERSTKHGHSRGRRLTTEYRIWAAMLRRCRNPNAPEFKWYGARGISVCERWYKFENFLGDMGARPPKLTLDRIDNDGDYSPLNCRWATWTVQARNRPSAYLIDAIEKSGLPYSTVMTRVHRGWPKDKWFIPKLR